MTIPALLAKIGIPAIAGILSDSLGKIDHPAAKGAARALGELDKAMETGQIAPAAVEEANRHAEKMAEIKMREYGMTLGEINKSLRSEVASEDPYVRRMRPTFGYLMALTWAAQMFGLAYVMIFRTAEAPALFEAAASMSVIWTVGLSVLGVYVYRRSDDKIGGNGRF